ncbi:hypothetical protein Tco_1327250 [Tanacetum coccineum]
MSSTAGSNQPAFGDTLQNEFRLKREAAQLAYKVVKEKDQTLMSSKELRFFSSTTGISDEDVEMINFRKDENRRAKKKRIGSPEFQRLSTKKRKTRFPTISFVLDLNGLDLESHESICCYDNKDDHQNSTIYKFTLNIFSTIRETIRIKDGTNPLWARDHTMRTSQDWKRDIPRMTIIRSSSQRRFS